MVKSERGAVSLHGSGGEVMADITLAIVAYINADDEGGNATKEEKLQMLDELMGFVRHAIDEVGFEPDEVQDTEERGDGDA